MVYDENSTLDIFNYTVFITNRNGSQTFQDVDCNNPYYLSLQDIPYGVDTVFLITAPYYKSRIYYEDLLMNHYYYNRFYLPPLVSVVEEGAGDEGNKTINTLQYMLYVINVYNHPIDDAKITVKRYIDTVGSVFPPFFNTTVIRAYENITSFYTDGNGQHSVYLIPGDVVYKVFIEKDGYVSEIADYIPDRIVRTHTFQLQFAPITMLFDEAFLTNLSWSYTPLETTQHDAFNFTFSIDSTDNKLQWVNMSVYYYNTSQDLWVLLNTSNTTASGGGTLSYNFTNQTGQYRILITVKKIGFDETSIFQQGSLVYWIALAQMSLSAIPDIAFILVLLVLMILVMAFLLPYAGISTGYIGLGIFTFGLMFKPDLVIYGISGWVILTVTFLMYTVGIFLWSRL
jgi:hypothetical protein